MGGGVKWGIDVRGGGIPEAGKKETAHGAVGLTTWPNRTYDLIVAWMVRAFAFSNAGRSNRTIQPAQPRKWDRFNESRGRSTGAAMAGQTVPMFSAPSPREREALDVAASYLKRAGTEAGSRLMGLPSIEVGKVELIESLRNEMRESAALCECLIDLFDGWGDRAG